MKTYVASPELPLDLAFAYLFSHNWFCMSCELVKPVVQNTNISII
jgi:hypothetical protein